MNEELIAEWFDEVLGTAVAGHVINSAYCNVTNTWVILVAGLDGKFHSFPAEALGVRAGWAITRMVEGDDDDFEDDEDGDEG